MSANKKIRGWGMARKKKVALVSVAITIGIVVLFLVIDLDGDGLNNIAELQHNTAMFNSDTDGDGLNDGAEVNAYKTNPLAADSDGDGLNDGTEINTYKTSPLGLDTDDDGINDGLEVNGWSITVNGSTHQVTSNPLSGDSDGDQLSDWNEYSTYHTNPRNNDTDADGLLDAEEIEDIETNPVRWDTDKDGLSDYREFSELMTDPLSIDTDKDGLSDGREVENMSHLGANPRRGDIFVEIDWMDEENTWSRPSSGEQQSLVNAFKNAPIQNPDGSWGVDLHLFNDDLVPSVDNLDGLSIHPSEFNRIGYMHDYVENYKDYGNGFYYALMAKSGSVGHGGMAYVKCFVVDVNPNMPEGVYANKFMHELGHCLGLWSSVFDGIDGRHDFELYQSVMNYNAPYDYCGYSTGGLFDDWGYLENLGFTPWY